MVGWQMIVVGHDEGPEVGMTGARFGGARARRGRAAVPDPAVTAAMVVVPPAAVAPVAAPAVPDEPAADLVASTVQVRPYVLTGGRTRSRLELAVETLVSAVPRPTVRPGFAEQRAVVALCSRPRAIAEIAAHLRLPLGVAKVLVGDLAEAGAVAVHEPRPAGDQALLERVLIGLRRL